MERRRRIAWVWSISYTFASAALALATWAYLSSFYAQAHLVATRDRFSLEPGQAGLLIESVRSVPGAVLARDILALGGRAVVLSIVLAFPGFEMNQQVWAALRARPRKFGLGRLGHSRRVALYGWKLLALNVAILLSAPVVASLQFYLDHF